MAHEKRLLIDVFQAYFYRRNEHGDRELVFMSENLTSGGIVTSQENTDVRNGQGNTLFAILPGTKDVTVNLTENVFSFEALQLNSAGKKSAGAATGITSLKVHRAGAITPATAGGAITATHSAFKLDKVPENPNEVEIFIGDTMFANQNKAGQTANNVTAGQFYIAKDNEGTALDAQSNEAYVIVINADVDKFAKEKVKVMPFVYKTTDTKTSTLTIDAREFSEGGELWLQTVEKDEKQKAVAYVYFVFDNAMPEGNFEINTVSEVQPNDMTVNMRVLANENGELYRIIREEI